MHVCVRTFVCLKNLPRHFFAHHMTRPLLVCFACVCVRFSTELAPPVLVFSSVLVVRVMRKSRLIDFSRTSDKNAFAMKYELYARTRVD